MSDVSPPRSPRPATLVFTQTVLVLQALAALFATLVGHGLSRAGEIDPPVGWVWAAGAILIAALVVASGLQRGTPGRILGWLLQAPMLVAGLVVVEVAVIGAMFLGLWIIALRLGGRIDRERAERVESSTAKEQQ